MKVFISSVIRGFEIYRDAALSAAQVLSHEVKRAEDFPAAADSPQQACLAGVRWADAVLLILGERYGERQTSGLSATHEEYREARGSRSVLAFVQGGVERESDQEAFVREVEQWEGGVLTVRFQGRDELRDAVTRALHEHELARAAGPVDEGEVLERGRRLIPEEHDLSEGSIAVVVAAGPRQQIVRPATLGDPGLQRDLQREALFGEAPVLDPEAGTQARIQDEALHLEQQDASILLDPLGSLRVVVAPGHGRDHHVTDFMVVIEDDVTALIDRAFRFAAWVMERIDPTHRLTDVVPVVALNLGHRAWRTRAEHQQRSGGVPIPMSSELLVVHLIPARRHRVALLHERTELVEDLTALLRRRAQAAGG